MCTVILSHFLMTGSFPRRFMDKVNDGSIIIRVDDWPFFMYDQTNGIDPDNLEDGLCCGYLLVWVCARMISCA